MAKYNHLTMSPPEIAAAIQREMKLRNVPVYGPGGIAAMMGMNGYAVGEFLKQRHKSKIGFLARLVAGLNALPPLSPEALAIATDDYDLVNQAEIARMAHCAASTVSDWKANNLLPAPAAKNAKGPLWDRKVIAAWIKTKMPDALESVASASSASWSSTSSDPLVALMTEIRDALDRYLDKVT